MSGIEYIEGGVEILSYIKPMWEGLLRHHRSKSVFFAAAYVNRSFEDRYREIVTPNVTAVNVVIAKDTHSGAYVGYCVATIDKENNGEISSLFVTDEYRHRSIGDSLMKLTLKFLDSNKVSRKRLDVVEGNEEVLGFYARYGFKPRRYILEQADALV